MSWASALKSKKHDIELLQDPEIYKMFDSGIRGGMTFINSHHVAASDVDQLFYVDVNNLYGWALSQKLPHEEFKLISDDEEMCDILRRCLAGDEFDGEYGYSLEVDMIVPAEHHDKFDDLPLAPESMCPPGSRVKKLLLTHYDKTNYLVHCRLLSLWMQLGIKVTKVHRIIQYRQAEIFKDYINTNTEKRAATNDPFKRDFFKYKNNSLFGKTIENVKDRKNLRLVNNPLCNDHICQQSIFQKIDENCGGVNISNSGEGECGAESSELHWAGCS